MLTRHINHRNKGRNHSGGRLQESGDDYVIGRFYEYEGERKDKAAGYEGDDGDFADLAEALKQKGVGEGVADDQAEHGEHGGAVNLVVGDKRYARKHQEADAEHYELAIEYRRKYAA